MATRSKNHQTYYKQRSYSLRSVVIRRFSISTLMEIDLLLVPVSSSQPYHELSLKLILPAIDFHFDQSWGSDQFKGAYLGHRLYLFRIRKKDLNDRDRPRQNSLLEAVQHPSESGWNLPVEHPRHFAKFPLGM